MKQSRQINYIYAPTSEISTFWLIRDGSVVRWPQDVGFGVRVGLIHFSDFNLAAFPAKI